MGTGVFTALKVNQEPSYDTHEMSILFLLFEVSRRSVRYRYPHRRFGQWQNPVILSPPNGYTPGHAPIEIPIVWASEHVMV
ncbi:MAG: hypothetical protein DRP71_15745 [Verrucomicrobia bacterium]|nr:MAG: hypothetical protein DRP71_15745 [Verrucomicrobiota bacterium]